MAARKHALLGASGAKRWMACPPSAKLEDKVADTTSIHAETGTLAHELAEIKVGLKYSLLSARTYERKIKLITDNPLYDEAMDDYTDRFVRDIEEAYNSALALDPEAKIKLELKVEYKTWAKGGFGTSDVVIWGANLLHIIDFKYGKGVLVSAIDNPQLKLYALGSTRHKDVAPDLSDEVHVKLTINQPRKDHLETDQTTLSDLLIWAAEEVAPKAELAAKGQGIFQPGDHCTFCRIKPVCRAYNNNQLEAEKHNYKEAALLTPEEMADVLLRAKPLASWAKDTADYALDQAVNHGVEYPGYKLVEGRSNRIIAEPLKATGALIAAGLPETSIYNKALKGIGDLEKELGKERFSELLGEYIQKPQGKPTLIFSLDPRPAFQSIDAALSDFADPLPEHEPFAVELDPILDDDDDFMN